MAPSIEEQVQFSLRCNFAMTLLMVSVSGITLFMWLYMVSLYVEASPAMRKRRRPYLALSLVLFLLHLAADILWGLNIYSLLFEVTPGSGEYETFGDLVVKYDEKFGAAASLLADLALRLADAILLYRCYIIWTGRRWIIVVPVLIWLANLGINLRTYIPFDFWSDTLNAVDTLLIVILNVLLTGLIAFRLLRARKQLISALPTHDGAGRMYLGVLAILVESAAPIAISGVGLAVARLFVRDGGANWEANQALGVFQILSNIASPLCPQLILFRVAIGSSWANKKDTTEMMTRTMEFGTPEKTRSEEETGTELSSPS